MMKTKRLLIIDGNNRAHAAFHAYDRLSYKGKSVAMIYGLPSMIKYLLKELEPREVFVVWDGKRSKHREKLYPNYKGGDTRNRLLDRDDFNRQLVITRKLLGTLGIKQILNPVMEADDMIYALTLKARSLGYTDIIICSGDKDFNQLISREVSVWSESKKEMVNWKNCHSIFGYHSYQTLDWLTLLGDKSDNITGYPGMGEKRTSALLEKYGSIKRFLESSDGHNIIDKDKLYELVERNRILMDLRGYYNEYRNEIKIQFHGNRHPKIDKEKFLAISAKYGMRKFMSSGFINQFKWLRK